MTQRVQRLQRLLLAKAAESTGIAGFEQNDYNYNEGAKTFSVLP